LSAVSKGLIGQLEALVAELQDGTDPVEQALTAREIHDLADRLTVERVRQANRQGHTWRAIGARMGVPFQTLHRRYGGRSAKPRED
jgi:uncharacterized protein YerC